ncbi:hypothetical protein [Xanthomonas theicola]|nr:hypothetical protein [Xanthomonas theicola]
MQPTATVADPALTEGDTLAARLRRTGHVDFTPYAAPLRDRPGVKAVGALGVAASLYDAKQSGETIGDLLSHDNPLAARSELVHFAGRNVGGWAGGTAAAYALGSAGAGPMGLIAADAYFMSQVGEQAADLLDNRAIYHQTDRDGTPWAFDGRAWSRQGMADTTSDGVNKPIPTPILASDEKARELNSLATNAATALALKAAPHPDDPFRLPAKASDRPSLSRADWTRDAADGQWHRQVKTGVSGENNRGLYEQQTASPARAADLDAQAAAVVARNLANGPGAIAARYELAYHRSGWSADGYPMSPAVQQALPDPDALNASDGKRYRRDAEGQWTSNGVRADGNLALELDTTRALLQPALAEHAQAMAALAQAPPTPQDLQREQTLYRYRIVGTELNPDWREAIDLAMQRTRQGQGLTGDGAVQLQRGPGGALGADSPIVHLQRGADGVERIAAVTGTEDIRQALDEVRARRQAPSLSDMPTPPQASMAHACDGAADTDGSASDPASSPQHVLDVQAQTQAASAARQRQERERQQRQAQEQQIAQAPEHALVQAAHAEKAPTAQALQAPAALEHRSQALQQREQEQRLAQQAQQHEQQQRLAQEAQQREQQQRQSQEVQQHEQQQRLAQEAQQHEQQQRQPREVQQREQQQRDVQQRLAQDTREPPAQRRQPQQAEASDPQETQRQPMQERRTHDAPPASLQTAPIAAASPAARQPDARAHPTQAPPLVQAPATRDDTPLQPREEPVQAPRLQSPHAAPHASHAPPLAAERNDAPPAPQTQTPAPDAPMVHHEPALPAPSPAHLAQAPVPSPGAHAADRATGTADQAQPARRAAPASPEQAHAPPHRPRAGQRRILGGNTAHDAGAAHPDRTRPAR